MNDVVFLDLLFSKYANPFVLINGMIRTKRFQEFVQEFIRIHNEEKNEKVEWEFFLHKVYDQSFSEFKSSVQSPKTDYTDQEVSLAVSASKSLLADFDPGS